MLASDLEEGGQGDLADAAERIPFDVQIALFVVIVGIVQEEVPDRLSGVAKARVKGHSDAIPVGVGDYPLREFLDYLSGSGEVVLGGGCPRITRIDTNWGVGDQAGVGVQAGDSRSDLF